VQDEISHIIANKCRQKLSLKDQEEKLVEAPIKNLETYTLFLKGLHFHNKLTPSDAKKAISFFEEAISLEPSYAQAYAMAATDYALLGTMGQMPPAEAFEIVHSYSNKALLLDNACAPAYAAKGAAYLLYDWQWKEGFDSLMKAIELNPATTNAHQLLCFYYMTVGEREEAVRIMEQALKADPLSPVVNHYLAEAYFNAGRIDVNRYEKTRDCIFLIEFKKCRVHDKFMFTLTSGVKIVDHRFRKSI